MCRIDWWLVARLHRPRATNQGSLGLPLGRYSLET